MTRVPLGLLAAVLWFSDSYGAEPVGAAMGGQGVVSEGELDAAVAGTEELLLGELRSYDAGGPVEVIALSPELLTARSTARGFQVEANTQSRVGVATVLLMEESGARALTFNVTRYRPEPQPRLRRMDPRNYRGVAYQGGVVSTLGRGVPTNVSQTHLLTGQHTSEEYSLSGQVMVRRQNDAPWTLPILDVEGRLHDPGLNVHIGRISALRLQDVPTSGNLILNGIEVQLAPEDAPGRLSAWFGADRPTKCCTPADPGSMHAAGGRGEWFLSRNVYSTLDVGVIRRPDDNRLVGVGNAGITANIDHVSFGGQVARAGTGLAAGAHLGWADTSTRLRLQGWSTGADFEIGSQLRRENTTGLRATASRRIGRITPSLNAAYRRNATPDLSRVGTLRSVGAGVGAQLTAGIQTSVSYQLMHQATQTTNVRTESLGHLANATFALSRERTSLLASATYAAMATQTLDRAHLTGRATYQLSRGLSTGLTHRSYTIYKETNRWRHTSTIFFDSRGLHFSWFVAVGANALPGASGLNFRPTLQANLRWQPFSAITFDAGINQVLPTGNSVAVSRLSGSVTIFPRELLGPEGINIRGKVRGFAFIDRDANGIYDAGEAIVPEARVSIANQADTHTDDYGFYQLNALPAGEHFISVEAPGLRPTTPAVPVDIHRMRTTELNLPLQHSVRLDVYTFTDRNGDGTYQAGETGVPVPSVELTNRDTGESQSIRLNGFQGTATNIAPGRYVASINPFALPSGYLTDALEVDVQIVPGQLNRVSFDLRPLRRISGTVWLDQNGNGTANPGRDLKLDDVEVRLNERTLVSGPEGSFLFDDIEPGEYVLSIDRPSIPVRIVVPNGPLDRRGLNLVVLDPEFIERLATSDGYLPYIDPLTDEQAVDEASGRPVVINPATGGPATLNPQTGLLEGWTPPVAVAVADVEPYLDPDTGEQVVDAASGRPVVIDPATGLPALEDPNTGAMVAWTPPPEVAVVELSPYIDPETGRPVVDEATGRPVVVDPDTGLPALEDPDTGELVAWSPPVEVDPVEIVEAPSFVDPATSAPVIDPPSGRPVVVNPATGLPALQDPSTGEFAAWRPPAGMEVTLPPYVDPETGSAVIDPVSGEQVVVDPVTEAPALRDVNSGTFTPYDLADATPTPLVDPETGTAVTDPESGAAVVLHPRTGLPSVMDPELGRLVDWEPPDLPSYEPLVTADGTAVTDPQGRSVFLDDQGRTVVVDPDTNEATVVVLDSGPPALTRLRITPDDIILAPLEELQLTASGAFTDDSVRDLTRSVEWSSSRPSVLSVDAGGLLSANSVGFAELSASFEGVQAATVRVEVIDVPVAGLTIQPAELVVQPGGTMQMTAEAIYTDGRIADVTDAIRWFTSNPNVATVDRRGVVTGVAPGQATVNGEFQGIRGFRASIEVGDLGAESLVVQGMDTSYATGEVITPTLLAVLPDGSLRDVSDDATWEVSDPLLLAVSSDGSLRARGEGSVQVTASWGGAVSDTMTLTLTDSPPAGMTLFPPVQALVIGGTEDLSATAVYADGTVREVTDRADWVSSNPSVVEVLPGGRVRAVAVGSAQVTAARGEVRTEALTIRVLDPANAAVTLEPRSLSLEMGAEANLRAYAIADDERIDVTELSQWQSGDAGIATVSGTGRVSGVAPGSTRIFARWGSMITPNASVDVTLPPVLMVTGDLVLERLPIGAEVELSASAVTQADASFIDVSRGMEWRSSNPRVIAIRGNTLVAQSVGSATITGTVEGNTTQPMTIEVTDVRVDGLTLVELPDMRVGDVQPAYATANLADGTSIDLTWSVTWSSSNEAVLTVQEDNLLRATGAGTATLTATFGEVTVSRTVTVGR